MQTDEKVVRPTIVGGGVILTSTLQVGVRLARHCSMCGAKAGSPMVAVRLDKLTHNLDPRVRRLLLRVRVGIRF